MQIGETKDYKFGRKNNWRRQIWNQVRERNLMFPRLSRVLYLSGAQDLDRPVALSKGFSQDNLIAVDRSKKIVQKLRKDGVLALCGDFVEVLRSWPPHFEIDVVLGDYCCDISKRMWKMLDVWSLNPAFRKTVFVFNFQRGRNKDAERWREAGGFFEVQGIDKLHRGMLWWNVYIGKLLEGVKQVESFIRVPYEQWSVMQQVVYMQTAEKLWTVLNDACNPVVLQYRSGVTMDSILFTSPGATFLREDCLLRAGALEGVAADPAEFWKKAAIAAKSVRDEGIARSISAVLAHRTMRTGRRLDEERARAKRPYETHNLH